MATYDSELITPPTAIEAAKDPRDAEIMNPLTASTPRVSIGQYVGVVRRSVR